MKRLMGLDIGDKTIGVAISDPLGIFAQGVMTIRRESNKKDYEILHQLILEHNIEKVVVGLPKNMNNTIGPQGEKTIKFSEKLKNKFRMEVVYQDERLTSVSAERVLIEGNVRRENRKKHIDKLAATLILQSYMDANKEE
ncbi:Holliday junction resolvase RuvX [Peptoniphilus sp. KCTC 25270]|uniref:Holliday junction resolvase RuvX n=1 Tax=Peptoniphilus sp. KCTC 25270 TaxID=2897414 RepID=UPI001E50AF5C|nr:Holliday junction resolvase RuvX [Peptoniphilus sp. KCTC 25270]MCD1147174.1 Holliday junction resolvase RuvX [Peptoniphilus sp. KCTC 25270]